MEVNVKMTMSDARGLAEELGYRLEKYPVLPRTDARCFQLPCSNSLGN
jgi:hypothetical protein